MQHHTIRIDEEERLLLLSCLPESHPLAASLRAAPEIVAFEEAWSRRWVGPEPAGDLLHEAALLLARERTAHPHLVPTLERLMTDATRVARLGPG